MKDEHPGRKHIDARLLALIDRSESDPALFIKDLQVGDILGVQTHNTLYTMKVLDPANGRVSVTSNGKHITKETQGTVFGTTLTGTGTMVKMGWMAVGYRLILLVEGTGELMLSETKELQINGFTLLPAEKCQLPS